MIKVAVVDSLSGRLGSADQAKRAANHRHELLDSRQHWRQSIWHLLGVYITRCTRTGHHLLCHAGGSWLRYGTCINCAQTVERESHTSSLQPAIWK